MEMELSHSKDEYLRWSPDEAKLFGLVPQKSRHNIQDSPLFSDDSLLRILENYPRNKMRVFSSGVDPERRKQDWRPVDTAGASAADILQAVRVGTIWVNLQRIDTVDARFKALGDGLYAQIERQCPHFKPLYTNHSFLLISSPNAIVYLHADYTPNMLWHVRGHKRIWIYPPYDERTASRLRIEEICSGGDDGLEYRAEYDNYATVYELGPGDCASWAPRSPHRVVNGNDLNVSLSTFHETVDDALVVEDHCADYFFRKAFPPALWLRGGTGVKRFAYRACRKAGWNPGERPVAEFYATMRIDPEAPMGLRPIPGGPVLTEHSRLVKAAKLESSGKPVRMARA